MNHRTLTLLGALAFVTVCTPTVRAQSSQPAQPAPASPAATPTPSQPTAQSPSAGNSSPAPAAQAPVKKVWTNDDVGDLRDHSAISTVGNANPSSGRPAPRNATASHNKDARSFHDQIAKLQAQIPPIDEKINELQSALSGNQVIEERHFSGVKPDDWKDELARLQKQRDDIRTKIAELEDQARHTGVATNQIP
jgi:chaperonin cofactor prefoldin